MPKCQHLQLYRRIWKWVLEAGLDHNLGKIFGFCLHATNASSLQLLKCQICTDNSWSCASTWVLIPEKDRTTLKIEINMIKKWSYLDGHCHRSGCTAHQSTLHCIFDDLSLCVVIHVWNVGKLFDTCAIWHEWKIYISLKRPRTRKQGLGLEKQADLERF